MRARLLAVCSAAVLTTMVAASAASAASPEWFVAGSKLVSPLAVTVSAVTTTDFSWNGLVIACTNTTSTGAALEGEKGGKIASLTYSGCGMTSPTGCEVESAGKVKGQIKTKALSIKLEGTAAVPKYKFAPTEGDIADLKIVGASCAWKMSPRFSGTFTAFSGAKGSGPSEEAVAHNIQTTRAQTEKEFYWGAEQHGSIFGELALTAASLFSEK